MKEEKKKRIYLSLEDQKEIVRDFFEIWKGKEFGRMDFKIHLIENYEWFEKSKPSVQNSRLENLISIMKDMYGKGLEKVHGGQPGEPVKWLLPLIAEEIKTEVKEFDPKPKKDEKSNKRRCSVAKVTSFYNIIKMASKPLGGISKKDLASIMGYKNSMVTQQGIDSLNNLLEKETGYKPIIIDKSHVFTDYDIISVEKELAELIKADLLEKLGGVEPIEPKLEYEKTVKAIIKSDYNVLKMFLDKERLEYRNDDAFTFRTNVIKGCNITVTGNRNSIDHIVNSFIKSVKMRYGLEIDMYVQPRKYIQLQSSQDELKSILKLIEDKYAEYFCENIVPHELTILAEEIEEETSPSDVETGIITFVEKVIFKEKSGKMYLSEMWNKLNQYHFTPGWDIFNVLTKCDRFTQSYGPRPDSVSESYITYKAPAKEKERELVAPQELPLPKENKKIIIFSFADRKDIKYFCNYGGNILSFNENGLDREYISCSIEIDLDDKKSMLSYLKLHYAALKSDKIIEVFGDSENFANEIERNLFDFDD